MNERMAPGHPYIADRGTGIQWTPTWVALWDRGTLIERVRWQSADPWQFWHSLAFAQAFPDVSHWWFRSLWTGRIAVSPPQAEISQDGTIRGMMRFDLPETDPQIWTIDMGENHAVVSPPFPPNDVQPANIVLRRALAAVIVGVVDDRLAPDTWYGVTSLAPRHELDRLLPTSDREWQLGTSGRSVGADVRTAWCDALGLNQEARVMQ